MISRLLKGEPVLVGGAITATMTILVALGVNEALCAALGAAAVAWLTLARSLVAPLPHVVDTVHKAARDTGAQVASRLDAETAGAAGAITDHAGQLVDTAADGAADAALRALGVKRKERRP